MQRNRTRFYFSATTHGKELSACLSAKLNVGLATDCISIEVGEQGRNYGSTSGLRR